MKYNEEMFNRTLKAADLSTVDFESPIAWDDAVLKCGEKYLNALLGEEIPKRQCFGDADRYYYMMASHALYAAFCIANWEKMEQTKESSLEAVIAMDAIAIMRMNWREVDTENVDWYASTVYDMAIRDFQNKFNQKYVIDNSNEYMMGLLMAFFVVGYNLKPDYFDED